MDLSRIQKAAESMLTDALKDDARVLADRLSKVLKADRKGDKYTNDLNVWKVLRAEISKRGESKAKKQFTKKFTFGWVDKSKIIPKFIT